ncbi:PIG-L deacetylase family protein [Kitasatospora sp. NPDC101235]|uniref:PIG-L deacetylase family protein n=1 Tax=Kitasatospora sp. NPDC101235 TaxID=3364101 RepID=UPI00382D4ADC
MPRNPDDQPAGPQSVLAVFAHPDDAELWAGGTLALHAQHAPVHIAVPLHDPVRDAEAKAGAAVLGATLHQLAELTPAAIRALLVELKPHVVITHPVLDAHADHRHAAEAVLEALPEAKIETGRPRRLYSCDTYNSLTLVGPLVPTVMVDVTGTFDTKMRALRCHKSQPVDDHFGPMAEDLARLWGRRSGALHAEAFTALPVLGRLPGAAHL